MMKKDIKKEKKNVDTLTYLKRVKGIGIFGIVFSIALIVYDIFMYDNWMSIVSLIVDVLLLIFSIYFIVKSVNLSKRERLAIAKSNEKKEKKTVKENSSKEKTKKTTAKTKKSSAK